ncbi:MAG: LysR substrate-binding domain-containing protein [Polaromonas sp.]|nr:LysR substrate-binding domain-containing protein [Polaromonas sp.]MDI1239706.1 LysR substrate-binding domain-containing protein [Polaromonas sp.]
MRHHDRASGASAVCGCDSCNPPLGKKSVISLKDLHGERVVLLVRQSFVRHQIDDVLASLDVEPNVVLATPSSTIACALVAAGAGITLVGKSTAMPFAGSQVVARPIKEALSSGYAIIFPESEQRLQLADAFANELREEIRCSDLS